MSFDIKTNLNPPNANTFNFPEHNIPEPDAGFSFRNPVQNNNDLNI